MAPNPPGVVHGIRRDGERGAWGKGVAEDLDSTVGCSVRGIVDGRRNEAGEPDSCGRVDAESFIYDGSETVGAFSMYFPK